MVRFFFSKLQHTKFVCADFFFKIGGHILKSMKSAKVNHINRVLFLQNKKVKN